LEIHLSYSTVIQNASQFTFSGRINSTGFFLQSFIT
jgi:hypothetical protein